MITAARLDLSAFRNADWQASFEIVENDEPVDLTGWTLFMQLRAQPGQTGAPLATAFISATALELEAGEFSAFIGKASLSAIAVEAPPVARTVFYDLVATLPNATKRVLMYGQFVINPGVTL